LKEVTRHAGPTIRTKRGAQSHRRHLADLCLPHITSNLNMVWLVINLLELKFSKILTSLDNALNLGRVDKWFASRGHQGRGVGRSPPSGSTRPPSYRNTNSSAI